MPRICMEKDIDVMNKCYVFLFTCAETRAINLETTPNQSSDSLLLALRRFTARRGVSKLFISDNFKPCRTKEVFGYLHSNGIGWKFILEKSPWWGGFYERLIDMTKMSLMKTIQKARLNFDEFNTTIIADLLK